MNRDIANNIDTVDSSKLNTYGTIRSMCCVYEVQMNWKKESSGSERILIHLNNNKIANEKQTHTRRAYT